MILDQYQPKIVGHVLIRDKHTHQVYVDKNNQIHYGNMSWAVSQALAGSSLGFITHMIFGNGGTTVDQSGQILYRQPNTSNVQDPNALPYNPTYFKTIPVGATDPSNKIDIIPSTGNFSDLEATVTLEFAEPAGQDPTNTTLVNEFVFDEIALFTTPSQAFTPFAGVDLAAEVANFQSEVPGGSRMLTHVIFHPVQKAANVELEIVYTLRVQMGPQPE